MLALGALAAPAAAHDEMTGATPADGTSVEVPPAVVELTFTEPPLPLGSQLQVTGPDGEVVNAGDLQITDTVVSQPLASDLPAGDYSIAWRVTSSDGHPISGELTFTALEGTTPPGETATPEPTPSDPATVAPEPAETAAPPATAAPEAEAPPSDATGAVEEPAGGAIPWVVGALVLLLVGGTLWWTVRRRGAPGPQG